MGKQPNELRPWERSASVFFFCIDETCGIIVGIRKTRFWVFDGWTSFWIIMFWVEVDRIEFAVVAVWMDQRSNSRNLR